MKFTKNRIGHSVKTLSILCVCFILHTRSFGQDWQNGGSPTVEINRPSPIVVGDNSSPAPGLGGDEQLRITKSNGAATSYFTHLNNGSIALGTSDQWLGFGSSLTSVDLKNFNAYFYGMRGQFNKTNFYNGLAPSNTSGVYDYLLGWGLTGNEGATPGRMRFSFFDGTDGKNENEKMTLLSNGNLGIGTSGPVRKLQVYDAVGGNASDPTGDQDVIANFVNTNPYHSAPYTSGEFSTAIGVNNPFAVAFLGVDASGNALIGSKRTANGGIGDLLLTTSMTTRMKIQNSNGYVGIGMTSPNSMLDVDEMIHAREGYTIGKPDYRFIFHTQYWTSTPDFLAIAPEITATPGTFDFSKGIELHTNGQFKINGLSGTGSRMVVADANGYLSATTIPSGADNLGNHSMTQDLYTNGHNINYNSGSTSDLYISSSHHIGIGTNTTPEALTVAGSAQISDNVAIGRTVSTTYTLDVNGAARNTTGVWATSDIRFKKDILKIDNPLDKVMKLNGVSYNWRTDEFPSLRFNTKRTIGFIAQDLKDIVPEAVMQDENGYYAVNYEELIPVLTEAIKTLKGQLDEKDLRINELDNRLKLLEGNPNSAPNNPNNSTDILKDKAILFQNVPNPFDQRTTISYYIPASASSANLYIYKLDGVELMHQAISVKGNANIVIDAAQLSAGMYIYSLVVDGKEIDSKRMILTK